jgi:hypothetical protein
MICFTRSSTEAIDSFSYRARGIRRGGQTHKFNCSQDAV